MSLLTEFRCVVEFCPPTPVYLGFSLMEVRTLAKQLQQSPKARRAYRYLNGRKMVFGFFSLKDMHDFLWDFREMCMDEENETIRATYPLNEVADPNESAEPIRKRRTRIA